MNLNEWRSTTFDMDANALALKAKSLFPGLAICLVSVMAAIYITEHYGGPAILICLLIGMAFNNLTQYDDYQSGIQFSANNVLKFGVALLGVRITFADVSGIGFTPYTITLVGIVVTFIASYAIGRLLKLDTIASLISAVAVAICGVSAAIAIAAVLPLRSHHEKHLLCTIAGLTGVSTLAMIFYPAITQQLALGSVQSGLFLGASIHDVAQVAGAGYMLSDDVGDVAVYTKMIRVAALLPIIMLCGLLFNKDRSGKGRFMPPGFLIGFVVLALLNNLNLLNANLANWLEQSSRYCLLIAMVALGARTNLMELSKVGWPPFALFLSTTAVIALVALALVSLI